MSKIGYARISTDDQSLDLQLDALKLAGCDRIFEEIQSGAKRDRPVLNECLATLSSGDTLIIWKLDRLGRSVKHLIEIVEHLTEQNIQLYSITDGIDVNRQSAMGQLYFNIFAAFAQFERQLTRERSLEGIKAAKSRGVHCGRPKIAKNKIEAVDQLISIGDTVTSACSKIGIDRVTYYRTKKQQTFATSTTKRNG